jgi:hypothetical protein
VAPPTAARNSSASGSPGRDRHPPIKDQGTDSSGFWHDQSAGNRLILTGLGFSNRELVYSVVASTLPNDLAVVPSTSTNLQNWSFAPLAFLDATALGGGRSLFRYRLTTSNDQSRFFRMEEE